MKQTLLNGLANLHNMHY